MRLFRRKPEKREIVKCSNIIQYDDMGYPLRLVIMDDGSQIWIDSYPREGDTELKWYDTINTQEED